MIKTKEEWVRSLDMTAHPEGGWFKETYRSKNEFIPSEIGKSRNYSTSIVFLLGTDDVSHFHKIKSDELWCYHAGSACVIHTINSDGVVKSVKLGTNIEQGEQLQYVVPAGVIFGSESSGEYSLVGCVVSPGFDFQDFKLYETEELKQLVKGNEKLIEKFTKEKY